MFGNSPTTRLVNVPSEQMSKDEIQEMFQILMNRIVDLETAQMCVMETSAMIKRNSAAWVPLRQLGSRSSPPKSITGSTQEMTAVGPSALPTYVPGSIDVDISISEDARETREKKLKAMVSQSTKQLFRAARLAAMTSKSKLQMDDLHRKVESKVNNMQDTLASQMDGKASKQAEVLLRTTKIRTFFVVVWIICLGFLAWYAYFVSSNYITAATSPSTSYLLLKQDTLPWPVTSLCNWNQEGLSATADLDKIEIISCGVNTVNGMEDCMADFQFQRIETVLGVFRCFVFNKDGLKSSSLTGYVGSVAVVLRIFSPLTNLTNTVDRIGVQVSFTPSSMAEQAYQDIIAGEFRYTPPGFDVFYSLQNLQIVNQYEAQDQESYTSEISTISFVESQKARTETWELVGVTFAYTTLNSIKIEYESGYNIGQACADYFGVFGAVTGLDVIKFATLVPLGYFAQKFKSCLPVEASLHS